MVKAYEEVIDFIAAGVSSVAVSQFMPSEATQERVADLITREKTTGLTIEETKELNQYVQLEHLMRLAKAKARKFIGQ